MSPNAYAGDLLDQDVTLNIQSNTRLEDALIEWGTQVGMTVMIDTSSVSGRSIKTVVTGRINARKALDIILKGSGLSYTQDGTRIQIVPIGVPRHTSANSDLNTAYGDRVATVTDWSDAGPAAAATEGNSLSEVIVTAQKREERLQDVPVPVSVVSGESLVAQNALRLQDYYSQVPGFTVAPIGFQSTQILSFRGINTGLAGNPSVGVVVDDVPLGSSTDLGGGVTVPDIDPGDLVRVETLRGPQGTLYGASSLGGLLKFVTVDPSPDQVSGRLEAGTSSVYNGAELGYSVRGSTNLPVSDTAAVRMSAFVHEDPGYIDNPVLHIDGINEQRVAGGRLAALWQPSGEFSIKVSALYQRTSGGSDDVDKSINGYSGPPLGDLQQNYPSGVGGHVRTVQAYSVTMNAKLNGVDLTAVTGYNVNAYRDSWDYTFALAQYVEPIFTAATAVPFTDNNKTAKVSQEVRLSSSVGERLDWLAGVFYTHEDSSYVSNILAENAATGVVLGNAESISYPTGLQEYAAFGDLTYHFTDRFDVQFGGRVAHPELSFTQTSVGAMAAPNPTVISPVEAKSTPFTYLVTPKFQFSSGLMAYIRLASGYRSGGANGEVTPDPTIPRQYEPDKTYNYELGVKGNVLDHWLSFDTSIFYIDWKSVQLSLFAPNSEQTYISNVGRAKSDGIELSLNSKPMEGLSVNTWVTYNDAVLKDGFPIPTQQEPGTYGVGGDRLPYSSRFSGNFSLNKEFPITRTLRGSIGGMVSYIGNRLGEFTPGPPNPPPRTIYSAYAQTNLNAGVHFDSWSVNLLATNVFNKEGILGGGLVSYPPYAFTLIQPRTIGLNVSKNF